MLLNFFFEKYDNQTKQSKSETLVLIQDGINNNNNLS